jgi:hypothetical protein
MTPCYLLFTRAREYQIAPKFTSVGPGGLANREVVT